MDGLQPSVALPQLVGRAGPPRSRDDAIDTLARTLWGEARDQPVRGIEAIAAVVLNRVAWSRRRGGYWWGNSIVEVCRSPRQFPCWTLTAPDRARLHTVGPGDPVFEICLRIARRAVAGRLADPTAGATHYHRSSCSPPWAQGKAPSATIGINLFYAEIFYAEIE